MGLVEAVRTCLTKYVTFSGRARRPEFWWFWFACILAGVAAGALDVVIFGPSTFAIESSTTAPDGTVTTTVTTIAAYTLSPLSGLVGLATVLPLLAAGWRRLHDRGRSGWVMFLPHAMTIGGILVAIAITMIVSALQSGGDPSAVNHGGAPATLSVWQILFGLTAVASFIAVIWLFVQFVSSSQPGPNRFGPEPPAW
jgi:uncharacterized membrane protein YhaH (DUF805 family)